MSHGHDGHHDSADLGPPIYLKDRGGFAIPVGAALFVLLSIVISIAQGSQVVGWSPWGHVWPAVNSTTLQLPPAHLTQ
jgi:hypothetical protein